MELECHWLEPYQHRDYEPVEQMLVDERERVKVWAYVQDADRSYEFDEKMLVELDAQFYLLGAAGCSCPSPNEVWGIEFGPVADPFEIMDGLLAGEYKGFTLPGWALGELLHGISLAIVARQG